MRVCAVDGCGVKSRKYGYCSKHATAFLRHGDPLANKVITHHPGERFGSWTLVKRILGAGWLCRCDCGTERLLRTTSLTSGRSTSCGDRAVHPPTRSGPLPSPPTNYHHAHRRVRQERGPASNYACVDCGTTAHDWSYDGLDPDELTGPNSLGQVMAFSQSADHYQPRCRSCHVLHDRAALDRLKARRATP